jgi:type II secretory pathway component PulF
VAVVVVAFSLVLTFFFFAPVVPRTEATYEIWGGCTAKTYPPSQTTFLASASFALLHYGAVYLINGGYLWGLPSSEFPPNAVCG